MRLNVLMQGKPASGKGTQAARLAKARSIPKISTGDILRGAAQAGTALGLKAKGLMDRGEFLADHDMIGIVEERLTLPDAANGYILDGFPRTIRQAEALDEMLQGGPLVIVDLDVPDAELLRRMQERRVCGRCAAIAEPGLGAKAGNGSCEWCGGAMITRADDGDDRVRRHRLEVYARESKPLLDYYSNRPTFRSINGAQAPDKVAADLARSIDAMTPVLSGRRS